jgi:hypothetical protein
MRTMLRTMLASALVGVAAMSAGPASAADYGK